MIKPFKPYSLLLFISAIIFGFTCEGLSQSGSTSEPDVKDKKWWVLSHKSYGVPGVLLYNETTDEVERIVPLPDPELSSHSMDFDGESLWVGGAMRSEMVGDVWENRDAIVKISPDDGQVELSIPGIRTHGFTVFDDFIYYCGWWNNADIYKISKDGEPIDTFKTNELIQEMQVVGDSDIYYMAPKADAPFMHLDLNTGIIDTFYLEGIHSYNCFHIENGQIVTLERRGTTGNNSIRRYDLNTHELISSTETSMSGWLTAMVPAISECKADLDILASFDLPKDTTLCPGESVTLQYEIPDASYRWRDGSTSNFKNTDKVGDHIVEICLESCVTIDTITLSTLEESDFIVGDTLICPYEEIVLESSIDADLFEWNDMSLSDELIVDAPGEYWLDATVDGCTFRDSIMVREKTKNCICSVYTPNAFSRSGTEENAGFRVFISCDVEDYNLVIYDRWGSQIWSSTDPEEIWDGRLNGNLVSADMYSYMLRYRYFNETIVKKEKGTFTIFN